MAEIEDFIRRETAREMYRPEVIRWLLVTESPPRDERDHFYFTHAHGGDQLFIETMDALFREQHPQIFRKGYRNISDLRERKQEFLRSFKDRGFFLIDAVDHPITRGKDRNETARAVREVAPELAHRIRELSSDGTRVVLIRSSVYGIREELEDLGVDNIANRCSIPFPMSGQERRYRWLMRECLESAPMVRSRRTVGREERLGEANRWTGPSDRSSSMQTVN